MLMKKWWSAHGMPTIIPPRGGTRLWEGWPVLTMKTPLPGWKPWPGESTGSSWWVKTGMPNQGPMCRTRLSPTQPASGRCWWEPPSFPSRIIGFSVCWAEPFHGKRSSPRSLRYGTGFSGTLADRRGWAWSQKTASMCTTGTRPNRFI